VDRSTDTASHEQTPSVSEPQGTDVGPVGDAGAVPEGESGGARGGWRRMWRRATPATDPSADDEPTDPAALAASHETGVIVPPPDPEQATGLIPIPAGPKPPPVARLRRERRGLMRRREEMVFHLGGLAYELHRRELLASPVAARRADLIAEIDDAVHDIDAHLAAHQGARRAGRGGVAQSPAAEVGCCAVCRSPFVAGARFCSQCGTRFAPTLTRDSATQVIPVVGSDA
jgi:hypothetical protein